MPDDLDGEADRERDPEGDQQSEERVVLERLSPEVPEERGIRDAQESRGLGDVYKRQGLGRRGFAGRGRALKHLPGAPRDHERDDEDDLSLIHI